MSKLKFPILPLRGITVFPNMIISFPVGRQSSLDALEAAGKKDDIVYLVMQKDAGVNDPNKKDLYEIGTVAKIKQVLKLPGNITHVIVEGMSRGRLENILNYDGCIYGEVSEAEELDDNDYTNNIPMQALMRLAADSFDQYLKFNSKTPQNETMVNVVSAKIPGQLADVIAAGMVISAERKQILLECLDPIERLGEVIKILDQEVKILKLKAELEEKVKSRVEESQREYYLREQMKVIQEELGDKDGIQELTQGYKRMADEKKLPDYAKKVVIKEADRLSKMSITSPEANIIRSYVEHILELPWVEKSEEIFDINISQKILEADHYGLEKVKERILEFLAVRENTKENSATIICLVGPPGVGKTSIAKSIAKATGREYVRMSLGGVKDESEIRGHRRTYLGAMSGRIINAVKQAKTINPLVLLDEVDKLSISMNGDPSAALLEVLDSEQNNTFRDHYLDMPYDLSKVLFICTANDISKIPGPLKDRMEVITLSSYTLDEKVNIAMKHLYPKQLKANGLKKSQLKIDKEVFAYIVEGYTREAGVRGLERTIAKICRKAVKEIVSGEKKSIKITTKNIGKYLGNVLVRHLAANDKPQAGVVRGLAWTAAGGETLQVEVNTMKGTGKFEVTGNMGDVMKESAKAAITYIRSEADKINVHSDFYKDTDIHIHIPEGAVPKDGPSAGITMATAMVSALTGAAVRNDVAMTGEITIRGRILAIGGLKEKILAARQAGIKKVIVPFDNKRDLGEIPDSIKEGMEFVFAKEMDEVFNNAIAEGENIWR
ncbi:MAG: endopeptidase La [Lachnospiraceae bacterium]|nr:endopeptidase La [Lachnospiraceae bacterium]